MAQAGIHSLIGMAVRKWTPERNWIMLGIILGSMLPDADNLAVAAATVAKLPTEGLHRTFTHSLFTVAVVVLVFYLISRITKKPRWNNLGIGLGVGLIMHILLDLVIWFDGVAVIWPLSYTLNFWSGVTPPDWWMTLMQPVELLFFALFFFYLHALANQQGTDLRFLAKLRFWTGLEAVLFVVFLVLAFTLTKGFLTIFGAVYLLSLGLATGIAIRMRETIEGGREMVLAPA